MTARSLRRSVTATAGTAALGATTLTWSGPLPVGSSVTITYQVVLGPSDLGDHHLVGALTATGTGGSCASGCALSVPVQSYTASLAADTSVVTPGADVGYTVTIVNTGQVAYPTNAATVRVDLSGVADDAAYVSHSASTTTGALQLSNSFVAWSGALPVGATATVHFRVPGADRRPRRRFARRRVDGDRPGRKLRQRLRGHRGVGRVHRQLGRRCCHRRAGPGDHLHR